MERELRAPLREEIRFLRRAIEDIKRDLPIGEVRSRASEELDEGLVSFRPARPALKDLGTEIDEELIGNPTRTAKSTGSLYREDSLQRDLQDIKEKIESLRSTFTRPEGSAKQSPTEKEVQTQIVDIRTKPPKRPKSSKKEQLFEELAKLQAENQVLRKLVAERSPSPPHKHSHRPRTATRTKTRGTKTRCENCAFLQSKGFESGLCYRHRGHSTAWK